MGLPADYLERVYAGVLGKIIGVYMGSPVEGWSHERIAERFGEVRYYVNDALGRPLVKPDDDISGTFTFFRALADHGHSAEITAGQIGWTWLNYLIDRQTVLWWGGLGRSSEHTAYCRLRSGVPAPRSGSIGLNGRVVAEQIGAQIFIDAWGMAAPGDPALAARLARQAGSVSHDGEAVHGAQVVAAMVAMAFVASDIQAITDAAVEQIPADCAIARLIADVRRWRAGDDDWRRTLARIHATHPYEKYGGGCPMVPNHALIHLALQYAPDSFQRSQMIVNTAGWDTDCNAGNVGAILGVKLGLEGIDAEADFRSPVADRLLLPTADAGRCLSDAAREAVEIANAVRTLHGEPAVLPKNGARYHFELPGSVQGWRTDDSPDARGVATVCNAAGHSDTGERSLEIRFRQLAAGRAARGVVATFIDRERIATGGYRLVATPAVYSGQTVTARLSAGADCTQPVTVRLLARHFTEEGVATVHGEPQSLAAGEAAELGWVLPDTAGRPICRLGVELTRPTRCDGAVYLDWLDVTGTPRVSWEQVDFHGETGRPIGWVVDADHVDAHRCGLAVTGNDRLALACTGTREWADYTFSATIQCSLAERWGLIAGFRGMVRYYAFQLLRDGKAQLIRVHDAETAVLAEAALPWGFYEPYDLSLTLHGGRLAGAVNGEVLLEAADETFAGGAAGVLVETGRITCSSFRLSPV